MDESQPREQQPNRTRSRLTADGQISRRPRAVAGQRAAAKRAAGQPAQSAPSTQPALAADTAVAVEPEVLEPPEIVEPVETEVSTTSPAKVRARSRRPRRAASAARRAIVTAALVVALIAAVVVGAILAVQYRNAIRTDHARAAAIAAAERAAPVIFSYDYRHLDQDFSKAEAYLTGPFRDQYTKTTQTVVKPTALQYHGVVQAVVAKPANGSAAAVSVVSATPDQVVVLTFVDQSTTSTRVSGTQVDQNRVLLTLTHTSQGWLVSAVDAL